MGRMKVAALCFLVCINARAQDHKAEAEADPPAEDSDHLGSVFEYLSIEEVIDAKVSASTKTKQSIAMTPAIVSVVNQDLVKSYGWLSLNDVLYRQPGFAPAQDYERRIVQSRGELEGWANDHLMVLVDGVPQNEAQWGSAITWEATPLMFADNIEIVRGPASSLYGSNATSGVVAINTVSASPNAPVSEGRLMYGNDNTAHAYALSRYAGSVASAVFGFNYYNTDGNTDPVYDFSAVTTPGAGVVKFPEQDVRSGHYTFAKFDHFNWVDGLSLTLHNQVFSNQTGHGWAWNMPQVKDLVQFERQIATLRLQRPLAHGSQEYVISYQRESHTENVHLLRPGAYAGAFPNGVMEYEQSQNHQLFARGQLSYDFDKWVNLLGSVEYTGFFRDGSVAHYSNVDLDTPPGTINVAGYKDVGDYLVYLDGRPVTNMAGLLQLRSLEDLSTTVSITLGARYDIQFAEYTNFINGDWGTHTLVPGQPTAWRVLQQVSPRLDIVVAAAPNLTLKFLAAQALRTPSVSETFGGRSEIINGTLGPTKLQAETVRTFEVAADWRPLSLLSLRIDVFYKDFQNLVGIVSGIQEFTEYTNIYSSQAGGVELDVQFELPRLGAVRLDGFLNATYLQQFDEQVLDTLAAGIDPGSPSTLYWSPTIIGNLGLRAVWRNLLASAQLHYQGEVARRPTDSSIALFAPYRLPSVSPWATLDARVAYTCLSWLRVGVQATNLLGSQGSLVKNYAFPFDYKIPQRTVLGSLELVFG